MQPPQQPEPIDVGGLFPRGHFYQVIRLEDGETVVLNRTRWEWSARLNEYVPKPPAVYEGRLYTAGEDDYVES